MKIRVFTLVSYWDNGYGFSEPDVEFSTSNWEMIYAKLSPLSECPLEAPNNEGDGVCIWQADYDHENIDMTRCFDVFQTFVEVGE